jgi:hypothetical protein
MVCATSTDFRPSILAGVAGFEPAVFHFGGGRINQLCYTPTIFGSVKLSFESFILDTRPPHPESLRFAVKRVLAANRAVFVEFHPALMLDTILGRDIVTRATFRLGTGQRNHNPIFFSGHCLFL